MLSGIEALRIIAQHQGNAVVITAMSTLSQWPLVASGEELHLPLVNSMGKVSSLGLGIALARPDRKVLALDGDGSLLMNLGTLVTIANLRPPNLVHFLYQNNIYQTTGGQPIPGADKFNFAALAKEAGYPNTYEFDNIEELKINIEQVIGQSGPTFVCLKIQDLERIPPFPARLTKQALPEVKKALQTG